MEKYKEKNFVSAVIYINNNEKEIGEMLKKLNNTLKENFSKYEIICVNDASTDISVDIIKAFSKTLDYEVLQIINMSFYQGLELSMNAGVDLAVGDFVFEFDTVMQDYNSSIIMDVYYKCLEGYDIVSATSKKNKNKTSSIFYKVFNRYSGLQYKIHTETFRILSRRAINRVYSVSKNVPYRKAIYASCGLKVYNLIYEPLIILKREFNRKTKKNRQELGASSLILFTNIGVRFSIAMSVIMAIIMLFVGIYVVVIFVNQKPVEGWTTTMLFLSFAFFGLFSILGIIIKYLEIIVELIFKKKNYTIESIEKLK